MTKRKTWVMVKRGLITDPKHRDALGIRIWLYLYILDRADWEHGAVIEWTDATAAADLEMSPDTLRSQRRGLEVAGYIRCTQSHHKQKLAILKWVNPREYTGRVYNNEPMAVKDGDHDQTMAVTMAVSGSGDFGPMLNESSHIVTTRANGKSAVRPRNPLFDAIATVCQVDPATAGSSIGKVESTLAKAGYTPAEVEAFGRWWWGDKGMRKRPPRVWDLKEQIGVVRSARPEPVDRGMPVEVVND